jgi:hypothetical protein
VDVLLGSSAIDVESFNRYFVRNSPRGSPAPAAGLQLRFVMCGLAWRYEHFHHWLSTTSLAPFDDYSDRFSAADPILTSIFKHVIDVITLFVVELFNRSLVEGHFPAGVRHTDCEEAGTRCQRCSFLSTNLEPVGASKLLERCPPADALPDVC